MEMLPKIVIFVSWMRIITVLRLRQNQLRENQYKGSYYYAYITSLRHMTSLLCNGLMLRNGGADNL